jgi:hypothetical protein
MPKLPVDYSKTIIYKLVHKEDYDNEHIYIGSTTDFVKRKNSHKRNCNYENQKAHNDKKYQYIRENGGWDCFNMIEVEKFPCNDGNEARAREEYWRSHFNAKLNARRSYITPEERKEQDKEYYTQHKGKRLEYNEQHKDKILEDQKEYYGQNKDKLLEKNKKYYEQNKDKLLKKMKQQITCVCGCVITKSSLTRHRKTQNLLLLTKQIKYDFVDDNEEN